MKINDETNGRIDKDTKKLWSGKLTTQESRARKDLVVLSVLSAVVFAIAFKLEVFEKAASCAALHENWEVDEFLTLLMIIPVSLAIFAIRRWREYRQELIRRLQVEEELRNAKDGLELRVEERTAQLKESRDRFRDLVETTSDWVWETNEKGEYTYVSSKVRDILGYEPQEILNKSPFDLMDAEEAHRVSNVFSEIAVSRKPFTGIENTNLHKDGHKVVLETNAAPFFSPDGSLKGYRGIDRDISERQQAHEAIRENHENFLTFFETMDDIFVVGDTDGKIRHINSAASQKLAYTTDELKTMHLLDLNPKSQRQEAERIFSEMFKGERNSCPLPLEKKDGTLLPAETRVWFGKWSGVDCIFGICKDLSREQEALQKFNKFFELNPTPMAVSSLPDRKLMEVNESWLSTLGFSREEIIGKSSSELGLFADPETQQEFAKILQEQGSIRNIELRIRKKDGTIIEGLFSGETIDSQGRHYFVTAMLEITDRKRLAAERLEMERKLLHAQKLESLTVMAGGIAHDFNNQLAVVLGNLELALDELPGESEVKTSIINAITASKRSVELARQMLIYSGSHFYVSKDIHLEELLSRNVDLLKLGVPKAVSLNVENSASLPHIHGDPDQLQRVIMNLVSNASEAIGDTSGEVTIRTGVMDCDEGYLGFSCLEKKPAPGQFVFLEVSDTGSGMDTETQRKLFDPFFTTKFWGRGLGMAEVMGIVKGHRGAIMVDSMVGKGTTIPVLFPVQKVVQAPSAKVIEEVETKAPTPAMVIRRKTILIVEDEPGVRQLTVRRLKTLGYSTIVAMDGEEGVSLFRERLNDIDLVMLDFAMPKMNGVEAFGELIRIKPDVKVILTSGYTEDVVLQSFPGQRPAGVLHKPYKNKDLKNELECLLETRESGVSKDVNS
jgi:two-component system cell cycle sensor histidine kinase/response regulator CckA